MDDPYLDLAYLLDEDYVATKSYNDLLAEGIPREGGLAMRAKAERMARCLACQWDAHNSFFSPRKGNRMQEPSTRAAQLRMFK